MQEKVQSISVVIHRLLEVHAIRPNLALCFFQNDIPTAISPGSRCGKPRAQEADEEETDSLAKQMRIRREVSRKESINMPRIQSQGMREVGRELLWDHRATIEQVPDPQPG